MIHDLVKHNPKGVSEKLGEMESEIKRQRLLLSEAHGAIVTAITSEEGLDGGEGSELLKRIEAHLTGSDLADEDARLNRIAGKIADEIVEDHLRPCEACFGDALRDVREAIVSIVVRRMNDEDATCRNEVKAQ